VSGSIIVDGGRRVGERAGTDIPASRYSICSPAPVVRDESRLFKEAVNAVRGDYCTAAPTAARPASRSTAYTHVSILQVPHGPAPS